MLSAALTAIRLSALIFLSLAFSACELGLSAPELYPGLKGGMALPQVLSELGLKREQLKVVGDAATGVDDPRPAYHLEEFEVTGTSCLGVACGLRLVFFNEELAQIIVFPSDSQKFGEIVRWLSSDPAFTPEQTFMRRGIRFRSGTSDFVGEYFSFGDSARMRRADQWVYEYD